MKSGSTALAAAAAEVGEGKVIAVPRTVPYGYNDAFTVKQRYVDQILKTTSIGTSTQHIFRMSGWDPDLTGGGHQPFQRDFWASLYDRYVVLECEYDITVQNLCNEPFTYTAAGTTQTALGTHFVTFNKSTTQTDLQQTGVVVAEMKNAETKICSAPLLQDGRSSVKFKGTLTHADFVVDALQDEEASKWTAVGTNPNQNRLFGINIHNLLPAVVGITETPTFAFLVNVILTYTIQYTDVNDGLRQVNS